MKAQYRNRLPWLLRIRCLLILNIYRCVDLHFVLDKLIWRCWRRTQSRQRLTTTAGGGRRRRRRFWTIKQFKQTQRPSQREASFIRVGMQFKGKSFLVYVSYANFHFAYNFANSYGIFQLKSANYTYWGIHFIFLALRPLPKSGFFCEKTTRTFPCW